MTKGAGGFLWGAAMMFIVMFAFSGCTQISYDTMSEIGDWGREVAIDCKNDVFCNQQVIVEVEDAN